MQFKSTAQPALAGTPFEATPAPSNTRVTALENLLMHIPGEASGFYLMSVGLFTEPSAGALWLIFAMALILLVVVRLLAKASLWVMLTTLGAFIIWMFVLDQGIFHVLMPNLLPDPLGFVVALFYSAMITLLASKGIIK
jgi:hypothetical protein